MIEGETTIFQQSLLERVDIGGLTDGPTWELMALAAEHYQPTPLTDIMVGYVANFQRRDGSWWNGGVARVTARGRRDCTHRDGDPRHAELFGTPA